MNAIQAQAQAANVEKLALSNNKSKKEKSTADGTDFFAQFLQSITGQGQNSVGNEDLMAMLGGKNANGEDETQDTSMEMLAALLNGNFGNDWLNFGAGGTNAENQAMQAMTGISGDGMSLQNGILGGDSGTAVLQQMMALQNLQASVNGVNAEAANSAQSQNAFLQELMQGNQMGQEGTADANGDIMAQSNLPTGSQAAAQALTSAFAATSRATGTTGTTGTAGGAESENGLTGAQVAVTGAGSGTAAEGQDSNAESSSEQLLKGSMEWKNSVAQAQRLLKHHNQGETESMTEAELQALSQNQGKTDMTIAQNITTGQAQKANGAAPDMEHLGEQIKGGLARGYVGQEREFTVKLRPEGLGEVTVRLIKEANQITVSIVAASASTAKLLNDQLPTLKQNMQGFDVPTNIRDVEVAGEQSFSSMQQQMSMNQSNQQGQYSQDSQSGYGTGYDQDGQNLMQGAQEHSVLETSGVSLYA